MKKLFAAMLAAVLSLAAVGCSGNQRVSSVVSADEFYAGLTYPALLEKSGCVIDTETVYYADGTTAVNTWYAEKSGDFYNLMLEYDDGTQYFYNGNSYIDRVGKGLFYVVHFGWAFEDYQEYFLDSDITAPDESFTLLRNGSTVTASFKAGETAQYYSLWGVESGDTLDFVYELDSDGRIVRYQKRFGSTVMVERVFEYGKSCAFPNEIVNAAAAEKHNIFFSLHYGENETGETYSIPHGMKIYCGTGYDFYSDWECLQPFDFENTPILDNMEISISYSAISQ